MLAALSRRQHVEAISFILVLMVIGTVAELHMTSVIGTVSIITVGCRDLLILLLFAEEEGFLNE